MRRLAIYLTTALVVLAVLALAVAGCGEAQGAAQAGPTTPQGILTQAMTSATPAANATGQFDISLAANGDPATMPAQAKMLLSQPITVTGTFSGSQDPMAAELQLTAALAGQNIPLGMKMTGGKAWMQFMGQWYEMPAEMMSTMSTATTMPQTTKDSLIQAFKTAGIDPLTWISGLALVGEDDLGGTKTYHLTGNVDVNKIMADFAKIAQDKDLQQAMKKAMPGLGAMSGITGMMGSTGITGASGSTGSTETPVSLPTGADLQTMQKELGSMFQTLTVDVWITKDGYQLRQAAINAKVVPPAGEDAQGIKDITLKMNVSMAPASAPVAVTPPADAKPFSDLEKAFTGLQTLFSGMFGGAGTAPSTTITTAQ